MPAIGDNIIKKCIERFDYKIITFLLIGVVAFSMLFYLSASGLHSRPIADDYAYFYEVQRTGGAIPATASHYLGIKGTSNGRLSQAFLAYSAFSMLGEKSTRIAPTVLLILLCLSFTVLLLQIIPKSNKYRRLISIIFGVMLAVSVLVTLPSLFDSLYWLTSSTVYIPSLVGVILTAALAVKILKSDRIMARRLALLSLPFVVLAQSFGEGGAATSIVMVGTLVLWSLFRARRHIATSILLLLGYTSGFLINFLAPATRARQGKIEVSHEIGDLLVNTFTPYVNMINYLEWWHVVLACSVGFGLAIATVESIKKATIKMILLTSSIFCTYLLVLPLITFGISAYAADKWFAIRNYTVPQAMFMLFLVLLFYTFGVLVIKYSEKYLRLSTRCAIVSLVLLSCLALYTPALTHKLIINNQMLAVRDTLFTQRKLVIQKHIERGTEPLEVYPLPIMLKNTEALDVYSTTRESDWVLNRFKQYYGLREPVYKPVPEHYCLNDYRYTIDAYLCR